MILPSKGLWLRWSLLKRGVLIVGLAVAPGATKAEKQPGAAAPLPMTASEYDVKLAYLQRFPAYVEWPAGTFASAMDPVIICVLGRNPFGEEWKGSAGDSKKNRRPVEIRFVKTLAETEGCTMVFIPQNQDRVVMGWLEGLRDRPVLTITDNEAGLAMGAVLAFQMERDSFGELKVRFMVNQPAARAAGLQIGAELLRAAKSILRDPVGNLNTEGA